jgi:hypothetical protein
MFRLNNFYVLEFLDHELDNNLSLKEATTYKSISVRLVGKVIAEFDDYIVVVTWDCSECVDVYRIVKACITKQKHLKTL